MATMAQPQPIQDDPLLEDDYDEEEDEDFNPNQPISADAGKSASGESDSEDSSLGTGIKPVARPRKRKRQPKSDKHGEEAEDLGYNNSGDETIISRGAKKARKRAKRGEQISEDEGGEGGFVKTRRQAALVEEEIKRGPRATVEGSTVDVDALWKSMLAGSTLKRDSIPAPLVTADGEPAEGGRAVGRDEAKAASTLKEVRNPAAEDDTVTIHRTYQFAGKTHTETKVVPRDSAEARLYLAGKPQSAPAPPPAAGEDGIKARKRKLKLARRSMFEPIPAAPLPPREDLKLGVGTIRERLTLIHTKEDKGKKINVVEKSKMDWAGYVDKEGLKDELAVAGKSKGAEIAQKEFLDQVERRREEEAWRARMAGRAAAK